MTKAVVLLSGGLDSTVASYWAKEQFDAVFCLSFEYGQRHWVELDAARRIARMVPAEHRVASIGPSGLGPRSLLQAKQGEIATAAASVVPGRNLLFLWAGAVFAQTVDADAVVIGANAEDQADYADCRLGTISAMEHAMARGLDRACVFHAPFVTLSKADILREAQRLGCWSAVLQSWSCYDPQPAGMKVNERTPCERCPACKKRAAAFAEVSPDV